MAKIISYKMLCAEINHGTKNAPNIEQIFLNKSISCAIEEAYKVNYPIAEKEAIPGTIEVTGEFDPEPETPETDDSSVWDELDTAYQAGYDEGYTEGVNSAYDQ